MQLRISTKLVLLLLGASLLPLLLFGLISFWQVRHATVRAVTEGHANVSRRAAAEIHQYAKNAVTILESTAENMSHADLKDWQKERILKNYINRFDQFNRIAIRGTDGAVAATSDLAPRDMTPEEREVFERALRGETALSRVFIKDDLTPAMTVGVPVRRLAETSAVLVAEVNLLHLWYLVDTIKIGKRGVLHVLDPERRLIASGDGARKRDVFQGKDFEPAAVLPEVFQEGGGTFVNPLGARVVAVGTALPPPLSWSVIVEQPTSEAYALATRIGLLLAGGTAAMLLVATALGLSGGRRNVVDPIRALTNATRELARGNWDYRVALKTGDEFEQLGEDFNRMAVQLRELQGKLLAQERHAMFGRIASGLAHDLKHPIQAIENASRLMDTMHEDPEFRQTFRRTVEREFAKINLFLENLHNLTHEVPLQPVPLSVAALLKESVATFELIAVKYNVTIQTELPADAVKIEGDRNALNRVFSNLISNALQAMPGGGRLTVSAETDSETVFIRFRDTGMGIPKDRISSLFDDFVTTKRRGLGLGLAIVRKIIQQHHGRIDVESQVDVGTCFTVRFPLIRR